MTSFHSDKYFIRDSVYNLVELSLLARMYEENCLPTSGNGVLNKTSLSQTLLKMKATEGKGQLRVAIHDTDPVGFYWNYEGHETLWVHPTHRAEGVEQGLRG
ncbi:MULTISPECIES: hypothetical protein [unclassified Bdellovibrio]|uniref:hypothetical protein n=1 Tax=unclassified Bdellovibrio TaxID=2633795 RepID=UPI001156CCB6|nr:MULTISPECIES: hypothetical protein [unclassified Bdellovibrio]QDK45318.1 hypothetical protein DOM22_09220 [Bdellovibrio sp. ZAP7]QLY27018.1 hypothetical protein HW988_08505 [Bdellovibrio sp. KM01]